ncbi:MAG: RHS repeat-associated core domain-containing protein [Akkermansia sp.]|nr:RHS repeat-associated core domain-containing protein [Akkermansia sp.]
MCSNILANQRVYTYDVLGRPLTRQTSRNGQTVNDSFVHTYRSELASAQVNGQTYAYDYDNIGNRRMSIDASDYAFYDANELNQYSSIRKNEESAFVPTFDAAGNQTLVRTATGTWSVTYNAENRPVIFQKTADSVTTRITCTYDYMGRRATKKVEEITTDAEGNETTTLITYHRFIYRGYLQIGCCDLSRANHPCLWLITWDPTQPIATRPLAIQKDGTWYTYGWDLTKNICEIFGQNGYIRSTYAYTPFGSVTANGDINQPIQWSSEHYDSELALVYYNYRHYNPMDGRWINRDPIAEQGGWNLYGFVGNKLYKCDFKGLWKVSVKSNPSDNNTVVTDGKGGLKVHFANDRDTRCFKKCIELHEKQHIKDMLASNSRIAFNDKGKPYPAGYPIVYTNYMELTNSKVKAYRIEIECLKKLFLKSKNCNHLRKDRLENLNKGLELFIKAKKHYEINDVIINSNKPKNKKEQELKNNSKIILGILNELKDGKFAKLIDLKK